MSEKVFNYVSISGFANDGARSDFRTKAEWRTRDESGIETVTPFSLHRFLPLSAPEPIEIEYARLQAQAQKRPTVPPEFSRIDLEARWGTWIYDTVDTHNNTVEAFDIVSPYRGPDLGLSFGFESHNDAPSAGLRGISRLYPELLFKVFTQYESEYREYALYKNGQRFFVVFSEYDFKLMRADQWPMIQSLMPEYRANPELHALAVQYGEQSEEDEPYDEYLAAAREEARARIEQEVSMLRDVVRRKN